MDNFSNLLYCFYQIYRFKWLLSNRFYRASINRLPLTVQNDTDHLSVSAGAWQPIKALEKVPFFTNLKSQGQ